jgi:molybdopterin converting factor small subunit
MGRTLVVLSAGLLKFFTILDFLCSLQPLSSCLMLALNETYIDLEETVNLKNADEIAVIPPLSGG